MKKLAIATLTLVMMLCIFGCGSSGEGQQEQGSEKHSPKKSQITHYYDLSEDIFYQGVSIKADPSWKIKTPKECNFYIHVDDANGHISIQTVLHGQTTELDTAWKEFFTSDDSPSEIDEWSDNGIDYVSGIVRKNSTNYWLLAGNEKSSEKGFLMSFVLSKEVWSEADQKQLFNDVTNTLRFDPTVTNIDFHDWWDVNVLNNGSSSDTGSSELSNPDQVASTPTISQQNALKRAKDYLEYTAFSYTGLIEQLEYEKFSTEDATYGADNCGADWNEQAAKKAESYLEYTAFSRDGLIDQLEYEGFTHEQAVYGVDSVGL